LQKLIKETYQSCRYADGHEELGSKVENSNLNWLFEDNKMTGKSKRHSSPIQ